MEDDDHHRSTAHSVTHSRQQQPASKEETPSRSRQVPAFMEADGSRASLRWMASTEEARAVDGFLRGGAR